VKVTYFGGERFEAEHLRDFGRALKMAALKTFEHNYRGLVNRQASGGRGEVTSERLGEWSASYAKESLGSDGVSVPESVKMDLWPFRRYSYM
jgi:hypothetical protein